MLRTAKFRFLLTGAVASMWPGMVAAQATGAPSAGVPTEQPSDQTASPADPADPTEDVVVTGIRASLANAIERKRQADQIVDTISAEDIGKLPDNNIAESIQRITGVQITRDEGEGRGVNIRGLTAQTTINGRVQVGPNSRDYDFRNLAAEFFQTIEVFKSPVASQPEGALGGTVNLITRKPLDFDEFTASVAAEGQYSDFSERFDPRGSVFLAAQGLDNTLGLTLTGTYAMRHIRSDYFQALGGWQRSTIGQPTGFDFNPNDASTGRDVIRPVDLRFRTQDARRERYGVDATVQWRPTDELEVRIDGTYTRFVNIFRNQWFRTLSTNPTSVVPGSLRIDETGSLLGATFTNQRVEIDGRLETEPVNLYTAGGNVKWERDRLTVTADASYAKSTNKLFSQFLRAQGTVPATAQFDFRGEDIPPTLVLTNAAGAPYDLTSPGLYVPNLAQDRIIDVSSNELAGRVDLDYRIEAGPLRAIKFGGRITERDNIFRVETSANQAGNRANPAFFDPATGRQLTFADSPLNTFNGQFSWGDGLFPDEGGTFPRSWFVQYYNLTDADTGSLPYLNVLNIRRFGGLINSIPEQSDIRERTWAVYGTLDFAGDVAGMEFKANAGLRYVRTDSNSAGLFRNAAGAVQPIDIDNDYGNFLPAANVTLNITPNLLVRVAGARVMQRANLTQLALGYNINLSAGNATTGNPTLKPFLADQADVSIEWYPIREALISAAGFYKDVKNFTTSSTFTGEIPGITRLDGGTTFTITQPINGGGGTIKGFEVGAQLPFFFLPAPLDGFGAIANFTYSKYDTTTGFPIPGLSERSLNLIGYFERGGFSARAAYSWRSDYNTTGEGGNGLQVLRQFEYIAPAGYLDASISYNFSDDFTVVLNGTNLLRTKQVLYAEEEARLRDLSDTDRRISAGFRLKF